jgi:hypothetical protein
MRYVTVPGPVVLKNLVTGEDLEPRVEWDFHKFLVNVVLPDSAMGKGFKADLARFTIEALAKNKKAKVLEIEDEHWNSLKKAVESPQGEIDNRARMQLLPFQKAIVEAADKDPRPKKKGK